MKAIPTKEQYTGFIEEFKAGLASYPDVCWYGYGSAFGNNCSYGRSDVDGGLIVDGGVVINKEKVLSLSKLMAACLQRNRVPLQFNLLDRVTNRDGRFLSYTSDFTDHIQQEGTVLAGPAEFVDELHGLDFKTGPLYQASHNFRKARNGLLSLCDDRAQNSYLFVKNVKKALENFAAFPKKLLLLQGRELFALKSAAQRELATLLPDYDTTSLERVNEALKDADEFHLLVHTPDIATLWSQEAVTGIEELIKAYLEIFPEHSEREYKK